MTYTKTSGQQHICPLVYLTNFITIKERVSAKHIDFVFYPRIITIKAIHLIYIPFQSLQFFPHPVESHPGLLPVRYAGRFAIDSVDQIAAIKVRIGEE